MSDAPPAATIVIKTEHELSIFRAMLDRHEKGTIAAINTVEAFGGDPHSLRDVIAHLALWKRQAALQGELLAPRGDDAAKGTPLGDALSHADDTGVDGVKWGDIAPHPRPRAGQLVRWPSGTATSIVTPMGFRHHELKGDEQEVSLDLAARLPEEGYFDIVDAEGWRGYVVSHLDEASGAVEWRIATVAENVLLVNPEYPTPRIIPPASLAEATALALGDAKSHDAESGEDVLDDYGSGTSQAPSEGETPVETTTVAKRATGKRAAKQAANHPGPVAEGVKGRGSQRERNASAAGVVRSVPKPVAGGKRAGRKGGR